jgi:hypothetical protein
VETVVTRNGEDIPIKTSGLLVVGDGTAAIVSVSPPGIQKGEQTRVTITGAFTHFKKEQTKVSVGSAKGYSVPVTVVDENHLYITIPDATASGSLTLSVTSGPETVTAPFTIGAPEDLIVKVTPDDTQSPVTSLRIIGDKNTQFGLQSKVKFSNPGIFVYSVKPDDKKPNELVATVDIAPRVSGSSDITVTTGARIAAGTAVYRVNRDIPILTQVNPAGIKTGETTPITVTKDGTAPFAAKLSLKFDATGIAATDIAATGDKLTAIVTPSSAIQTPANFFAITGSGLANLRFIHPRINPDFVSDTLVTFALTDAQISQIKNLEFEYAPGHFFTQALPSTSSAPAPAPTTSLTAMTTGIPATQTKPLSVKGVGMSQVVSVHYNDQPLSFNVVSDTEISLQLTQNGKSILSAPGIVVVFQYSDKTLKPYPILVTAPK